MCVPNDAVSPLHDKTVCERCRIVNESPTTFGKKDFGEQKGHQVTSKDWVNSSSNLQNESLEHLGRIADCKVFPKIRMEYRSQHNKVLA